jgi:hypothetical protein
MEQLLVKPCKGDCEGYQEELRAVLDVNKQDFHPANLEIQLKTLGHRMKDSELYSTH